MGAVCPRGWFAMSMPAHSGKLADRGFALNPRGDHPLIVNGTNGLASLRHGNFFTICRGIDKLGKTPPRVANIDGLHIFS
jgi:hypothetical protein